MTSLTAFGFVTTTWFFIVVVTACDENCLVLSGGTCFDGVGFLARPSCGCTANQLNDTYRCFNISSSPGATATSYAYRNLTYEGGFAYPQNWTCHNASHFCWTTSLRTLMITSSIEAFSVISNFSAGSFLSLEKVQWRCLDRVYRRAISLVGLQSVDAYCALCSTYCGIHGVCDEEEQTCVCYPGYAGSLCRDLGTAPSMTPLWDHDLFLLTYNISRGCTECVPEKERCYRDPVSQQGRCYCAPGRSPWTNCELTSTSLLEDVSFWNDSVRVDVTYDVAFDPRMQWITDGSVLAAAYGDLNVSSEYTTYVVDSRNQLWLTCLSNDSSFFWTGDPLTSCQGCAAVCGPYANCSASNAYNGTCVCLDGWRGTRCTEQIELNTTCAISQCSSHGVCANRNTECLCDPPYIGTALNCSALAADCRLYNCSGHGSCLLGRADLCTCDTGYYGPTCALNVSQCRSTRCTDAGECVTQTQGCTCDAYRTGVDCSLHLCIVNTTYNYSFSMITDPNTTVCNCSTIQRNGTHCENLICKGHGTFSNVTGLCTCTSSLYLQPDCGHSSCEPRGTVQDGPPAVCLCPASLYYQAAVSTNLSTCELVCQHGGSYLPDPVDSCKCDESRYYGSRCESAYPSVPMPYESDWFYSAFVTLVLALWLCVYAVFLRIFTILEMPEELLTMYASNRERVRALALEQSDPFDVTRKGRTATGKLGYVIPLKRIGIDWEIEE